MDTHCRDILQPRLRTFRQLHAKLSQQVIHRLRSKLGLPGLVTGTLQADHQAIAHQLIFPGPLRGHQIQQWHRLQGQADTQQSHNSKKTSRFHYQNGDHRLLKKRPIHPMTLASAISPLPV